MKAYTDNKTFLSEICFDKEERKHIKTPKSRKKRGTINMERSYKKSMRKYNKYIVPDFSRQSNYVIILPRENPKFCARSSAD